METARIRHFEGIDRWATFVAFDRAVRRAQTETQALQLAADTVVGSGLYRCVVISLHDEHGNLGAIGHVGVPPDLIESARRAPRVRKEVREAVLQERHRLSQSYYIPVEAGIDLTEEARHIPSAQTPDPESEWHPGDELFTPLRQSNGNVLGFCSVDEPFDRRRPTLESTRFLELIIERAATVVEHLAAMRSLATAEDRVSRIVTQCEDVVYKVSATTRTVVSASPSVRELVGVDAAELIGLATGDWIRRFVHPDDREKVSRHHLDLSDAALGGSQTTAVCEYRILRQDGVIRWVRDKTWPTVDDDGQVAAFEGLIRDITSIRLLSGRLAQSEQRYRLIADNARDLIYARDTDGNLSYISPSVTEYLGVTPEEFLSTHFSACLTDNPRNRAAFEAFDTAPDAAAIVSPFILELQARDGRVILMEFNESPVHDEHGRVVGAQGVGRDITEREELLRSLRAQSERADATNAALKSLVSQSRRRQQKALELTARLQTKVTELESFVHIISHDLRAPLITLQGLTTQLRRRYARLLDERGRETTAQITAESRRLMRLITDLLDYVRAGSDDSARRAVDVGLLTEAVWTRMEESNRASEASISYPETPILVWADPVALERVMENLISNAIVHRDPERPVSIALDWSTNGDQVEVVVRDDGPGIDPEDRDRIFELFYRGQGAEAPGSGLGLAIVRRILESSSGSVRYEPNPGGGSVFYLTWPAHPAAISRKPSAV